ncbi:hypothetical protein IL306_008650, partial [Fusarium sp. DS 682]
GAYDKDKKFTNIEIIRAIMDWRVWALGVSQFGINVTFYALTNFMPRIISGLGFTTTVNAQLLTIPVYFVSTLSFLIIARISDRLKLRSPFIAGGLCSCIGMIGLAVQTPLQARDRQSPVTHGQPPDKKPGP